MILQAHKPTATVTFRSKLTVLVLYFSRPLKKHQITKTQVKKIRIRNISSIDPDILSQYIAWYWSVCDLNEVVIPTKILV